MYVRLWKQKIAEIFDVHIADVEVLVGKDYVKATMRNIRLLACNWRSLEMVTDYFISKVNYYIFHVFFSIK